MYFTSRQSYAKVVDPKIVVSLHNEAFLVMRGVIQEETVIATRSGAAMFIGTDGFVFCS